MIFLLNPIWSVVHHDDLPLRSEMDGETKTYSPPFLSGYDRLDFYKLVALPLQWPLCMIPTSQTRRNQLRDSGC